MMPGLGIPDSDGFGRGSDSGGFGWIPGPRNPNAPTEYDAIQLTKRQYEICGMTWRATPARPWV